MEVNSKMTDQNEVAEVATMYLRGKWEKNQTRSLNIYAEFIDVPSRSTKAVDSNSWGIKKR